jgi:hypothetical protein
VSREGESLAEGSGFRLSLTRVNQGRAIPLGSGITRPTFCEAQLTSGELTLNQGGWDISSFRRNSTAVPHSANRILNLTKLCEKFPAFSPRRHGARIPLTPPSPAPKGGRIPYPYHPQFNKKRRRGAHSPSAGSTLSVKLRAGKLTAGGFDFAHRRPAGSIPLTTSQGGTRLHPNGERRGTPCPRLNGVRLTPLLHGLHFFNGTSNQFPGVSRYHASKGPAWRLGTEAATESISDSPPPRGLYR